MLIATLVTLALADALVAGKPAPALSAEKFLKGSPVTSFEKGKVYVVEFWATWCPPCRASVPHLTELQKSHPEVTVIGVAGFERKKTAEEAEKTVRDFVASQGDGMAYTVAFDADGSMGKDWMTAARKNGIPCAFVVDGSGTVTYIGSPDENLNKAVDAAAKGKGSTDGKSKEKSKEKSSKDSKDSKDGKDSKSKSTSGSSSSSGGSSGSSSGSSSSSSSSHSGSGTGQPR